MIDIIIPVYNEEKILKEQEVYYKTLAKHARVFFVDGSSADQTAEIAQLYGQVVLSEKGRGAQKNIGAKASSAEYLLFLHVDAFIDNEVLKKIPGALGEEFSAGCFRLKIEDKRFIFRIYEWAVNVRAKLFDAMDGDLGLFIRRDVFMRTGGFDEITIMEDLRFGRKLSTLAPIKVLDDCICVSSRKWDEKGFIRTFFEYSLAYVQLWTGIQFFK